MQKQEFEERIERTVTDEQYKVIEEVYMWHPSIRNTSGKDERHLMSFRWRLTPEILRQASQTFRSSSIHLWKMQSVIKSSAPEA